MNSFCFCLSRKFCISPSILKDSFAKYSWLAGFIFPRNGFWWKLCWGIPLYHKSFFFFFFFFPFAAFNIFSLSLIFDNLIIMCLGMSHFWFILFEVLCASWIWMSVCFPSLRTFSAIISLNNLFVAFFSFWDSYDAYVDPLDSVP